MAKRLTETDIRRIFREEAERESAEKKRLSQFDPDILKAWGRLIDQPALYGIDMVKQVIDTYWEVVEEDLNEPDQA